MRGAPAWHRPHSVQHPSTVLALRANPPSPTRGEGKTAPASPLLRRDLPAKLHLFLTPRSDGHMCRST
ncbi:MAG: hypothetical protein EOR95_30595 [Mesorhizobium sp.]|nr:MAG: hypothetical protein EOR95_30595 [Mesorhizobium sp.]